MNNLSLIIGMGEIGISLFYVLKKHYCCYTYDINDKESFIDFYNSRLPIADINYLHICFPYNNEFNFHVKEYIEIIEPKYVIIHSTVPVGTCQKLSAIHSPVIGIHPHLEKSLITFIKFLGGEKASEVADYFRRAGIKVHIEDKSETTELLKIQCTTFYGICIEFYKEMKNLCDKYQIPYDSWILWCQNYNKGYEKLGYEEYKKPLLTPIMGKQGGHCVMNNIEFLDTEFTKLLKKYKNIA